MAQSSHRRFTRLTVAVAAALAVLVGFGAAASGGGWAVGSLDDMPEVTAGRTVEVGFTILQHGVTPVDLTDDVGIELVRTDGTTGYFAAEQDGAVGHYTAPVTFPTTTGEYSWSIRMGWFGPQDLGTVHVRSASETVPTTTTIWSIARWTMLALTVVFAAVALSDLVVKYRSGRAALS